MTHKQRAPVSGSSSSRTNKALRQRIEVDLAQFKRCQRDEHAMQATQSPSVVVCMFCRRVGVCLWCGVVPPQGASIAPCRAHAHLATSNAARAVASTTYPNGKDQTKHDRHRPIHRR